MRVCDMAGAKPAPSEPPSESDTEPPARRRHHLAALALARMPRPFALAVTSAVAVATIPSPTVGSGATSCGTLVGWNFVTVVPNASLPDQHAASTGACCSVCQATPRCQAFSFYKGGSGICRLKTVPMPPTVTGPGTRNTTAATPMRRRPRTRRRRRHRVLRRLLPDRLAARTSSPEPGTSMNSRSPRC